MLPIFIQVTQAEGVHVIIKVEPSTLTLDQQRMSNPSAFHLQPMGKRAETRLLSYWLPDVTIFEPL